MRTPRFFTGWLRVLHYDGSGPLSCPLCPNMTIGFLKAFVGAVLDLPLNSFKLRKGHIILVDERTIEEYGITNAFLLQMVLNQDNHKNVRSIPQAEDHEEAFQLPHTKG